MKKKHDTNWIPKAIIALVLLLVLIACLFFVLLTPAIVKYWIGTEQSARGVGEFGDQFGLTNAVFSGLALFFVAVTLLLQTHELRLQRDEINESQELSNELNALYEQQALQLKFQSRLMEDQNQSNQAAAFDSSFYSLFRVFREIQSDSIGRMKHEHNNLSGLLDKIKAALTVPGHPPDRMVAHSVSHIQQQLEIAGKKVSLEGQSNHLKAEYLRICNAAAYKLRAHEVIPTLTPYFDILGALLDHIDSTQAILNTDSQALEQHRYYLIVISSIGMLEKRIMAMHFDLGLHASTGSRLRDHGIFQEYMPFGEWDKYINTNEFKDNLIPCIALDY